MGDRLKKIKLAALQASSVHLYREAPAEKAGVLSLVEPDLSARRN